MPHRAIRFFVPLLLVSVVCAFGIAIYDAFQHGVLEGIFAIVMTVFFVALAGIVFSIG
jgi:hypothetical protein